jgi:hypothetical protein
MSTTSNDLAKQGIAAVKAGNKEQGATLLKQSIRENKNNQAAWLWLSSCVDSNKDKIQCLEWVISIDPNTEAGKRAAKGLERLHDEELPNIEQIIPNSTSSPVYPTPQPSPHPSSLPTKEQSSNTKGSGGEAILIFLVSGFILWLFFTRNLPIPPEISVYIPIWVLFGIITAPIYKKKGNSAFGGFILGFLLGPIGLLAAVLSKPKDDQKETQNKQEQNGGIGRAFLNIIAFLIIVYILFQFAILFFVV